MRFLWGGWGVKKVTKYNSIPCPKCEANLALVSEYPDSGTGYAVALIGLILAPLLIGIPTIIRGLHVRSKYNRHWHCSGCGTIYPADK